jgi:hypothetical protein
MNAWLAETKAWRKKTTAYQEATGAYLERKEPITVKMASVAAHPEDSNDGSAVETVRALKDRYGDRHLAVGRRRQPKKRTQDGGGSRKKTTAARRRMIRRAVPARNKGRGHKGLTVETRRRNDPECNNAIRNRGERRQVRLKKERTSGRIFRKTVELEIERRIVGSSTRLQEESDWILWGVGPLRNERRDVQSTALGKDDGGTPGPARNLPGKHSGRAPLGREQREQLERNHLENRFTGKKGETDHRRHKHSPRKRTAVSLQAIRDEEP